MLFDLTVKQQDLLVVLIEELSHELLKLGQKIATVESCTGGMVSAMLTAVAGSSGWFDRGFVTYSNEAKTEMVGVNTATLDRYGAVSEEVAAEMALGGANNSAANCALSITGIAGPEGGSEEKPVGTVCFGWAGFGGAAMTECQYFAGDRAAVRLQSALYALTIANKLNSKSN